MKQCILKKKVACLCPDDLCFAAYTADRAKKIAR